MDTVVGGNNFVNIVRVFPQDLYTYEGAGHKRNKIQSYE